MVQKLTIGTRGSKLALWQSNHVASLLTSRFGVEVELVHIKTTGDKILDVPLAKIGDKGLFVKELEVALLDGSVDLAVHSMKDVPTELPGELGITAMLERADARDSLISKDNKGLAELPLGTRVGTSSLRRKAQLLVHRPDLELVDVRGNLETRLRKMEEGQFEAIILASAGLDRMGYDHLITERLSSEISLSAVGQGAIGIETRLDDDTVNAMVTALNHQPTFTAVLAERGLLRKLEGGCQIPIGAFATLSGSRLSLAALVAALDGQRIFRDSIEGDAADAEELGVRLAEKLIAAGAGKILAQIRAENAS